MTISCPRLLIVAVYVGVPFPQKIYKIAMNPFGVFYPPHHHLRFLRKGKNSKNNVREPNQSVRTNLYNGN